jgi:hypothetical protein
LIAVVNRADLPSPGICTSLLKPLPTGIPVFPSGRK